MLLFYTLLNTSEKKRWIGGIYIFKVRIRSTRTFFTPFSGVSIVNFEQVSARVIDNKEMKN